MERFEAFCGRIQRMIADEKTISRKIENGRELVSELLSRQDWFFEHLKKMILSRPLSKAAGPAYGPTSTRSTAAPRGLSLSWPTSGTRSLPTSSTTTAPGASSAHFAESWGKGSTSGPTTGSVRAARSFARPGTVCAGPGRRPSSCPSARGSTPWTTPPTGSPQASTYTGKRSARVTSSSSTRRKRPSPGSSHLGP